MAKVLVVGGGGRESALAWALSRSPKVATVHVCPGNGGTAMMNSKVSNIDVENIPEWAEANGISLVVVGPEAQLEIGLADKLAECKIPCFGPTAAAARIECSKAWAKDFMVRYGIPTAESVSFTDFNAAAHYLESCKLPIVIKASGLAAGKGVVIAQTKAEAIDAAKAMLLEGAFGAAGSTIIVEQYLTGTEFSVLAFCDGSTMALMPPAKDHKRAYEFDMGPNTGGMGVIAPAPGVTKAALELIRTKVFEPALNGLQKESCPFIGVLFAGIMWTADGPVVLEFNCRFGDPETQALLPLLATDLFDICDACVNKRLSTLPVIFLKNKCSAVVVVAAPGYPEAPEKGQIIGPVPADTDTTFVFHAGTQIRDGNLLVNGGRVFAVAAIGPSISAATSLAFASAQDVRFEGAWFRRDIGGKYSRPHSTTSPVRIAVLGSTNGTDLVPIVRAIESGELSGVEVTLVCSNKEDSGIMQKAKRFGIEAIALPANDRKREAYDAALISILNDKQIDLVLLIGFMRILSKKFTDRFAWRILNVHPSLLPDFAGGMDVNVHQAVLNARRTRTGCTVHFVTDQVDSGPILIQKVCDVAQTDTALTLKERVQGLEAQAFVEVLSWFADDHPYQIWQSLARGKSFESIANHLPAGRLASSEQRLTYASAGVDIDAGDSLVEKIKPLARSTRRLGADADLGGFGGLFDLARCRYTDPILVSSTDGVGTKLRVAIDTRLHDHVGQDLVAMSVNDLIVQGAEPIIFLDYFATGKLDVGLAEMVLAGVADGCRQAGCALVGGETAEMPSMYALGDYDLAGFAVGLVERGKLLPRLADMQAGDVVIGIASNGFHSNGFSLVRKVLDHHSVDYNSVPPFSSKHRTIGEELMEPTRIYVKCLLRMLKEESWVKGLAHITGGGLPDNIPRSLPPHLKAVVKIGSWPVLPCFTWLGTLGRGIGELEMLRTFNCGIGMVLVVNKESVASVLQELHVQGEKAYEIGNLEAKAEGEENVHVDLINLSNLLKEAR